VVRTKREEYGMGVNCKHSAIHAEHSRQGPYMVINRTIIRIPLGEQKYYECVIIQPLKSNT